MARIVGKLLSILIAGFVIACAFATYGDGAVIRYAAFYVLPLALIWFPDEMAGFTGSFGRHAITEGSPPGCVYAAGWVMLLLPFIMAAIVWMRT